MLCLYIIVLLCDDCSQSYIVHCIYTTLESMCTYNAMECPIAQILACIVHYIACIVHYIACMTVYSVVHYNIIACSVQCCAHIGL